MTIKATQVLKAFNGEPLKDGKDDLTLGRAISNILISTKEGGKMKLFILAKKFYSQYKVEVDSADLGLVKKAVVDSQIYNALVVGQVEEILEGIKEK